MCHHSAILSLVRIYTNGSLGWSSLAAYLVLACTIFAHQLNKNNSVIPTQCSFIVHPGITFLGKGSISSQLFFYENIRLFGMTNDNGILSAQYPCTYSGTINLQPDYLDYWPVISLELKDTRKHFIRQY